MELMKIVWTSLGSVVALFFLTKLIGYQQMSQLTMFDYINGISIGSIAAEMATALEDDYREPLIAMIIYSLAAIFISIASNKSKVFQRLVVGKPIILYDQGELYRNNFKKAKLGLNEFLTLCRISGYFDLSNIQTAILEPNGKISFLPVVDQRPVTPKDLGLKIDQDYLVANVILDGEIMYKNLKHTGKDEIWLNHQLQAHGVSEHKEVLLATCDINGTLHVYKKNDEKMKKDIFE